MKKSKNNILKKLFKKKRIRGTFFVLFQHGVEVDDGAGVLFDGGLGGGQTLIQKTHFLFFHAQLTTKLFYLAVCLFPGGL